MRTLWDKRATRDISKGKQQRLSVPLHFLLQQLKFFDFVEPKFGHDMQGLTACCISLADNFDRIDILDFDLAQVWLEWYHLTTCEAYGTCWVNVGWSPNILFLFQKLGFPNITLEFSFWCLLFMAASPHHGTLLITDENILPMCLCLTQLNHNYIHAWIGHTLLIISFSSRPLDSFLKQLFIVTGFQNQ